MALYYIIRINWKLIEKITETIEVPEQSVAWQSLDGHVTITWLSSNLLQGHINYY